MDVDKLAEIITDKKAVIMHIDAPTPIAYLNVYEQGDIWVKIQSCDACPPENRTKCCNNCGMFSETMGCAWHLDRTSRKPWNCIVKPYPDAAMPFCALEFKSILGTLEGKTRRVKDRGDIFQE